MNARIVEAPGIEGDALYFMRDGKHGGRRLSRRENAVKEGRTYFHVVREYEEVYPFGTYTDVHYSTFATREDAEEYLSWYGEAES